MSQISGRPRIISVLIGLNLFAAVATVLYWIAFFAVPEAIQTRPGDPVYLAFQLAFPLADGWFVVAATLGAIGLWKMRDWGFLFTLLAGSAAIFLGLMDVLFDLEHGIFVPMTGEALTELAIVVLLLTLGPFSIVAMWRQRHLFVRS
ncbi:MAG TPA: hypothetical protein EYP55_04135 [Anaerolineae bacterium]|nr:hypothetical protein [Anaerolineae bacterium]